VTDTADTETSSVGDALIQTIDILNRGKHRLIGLAASFASSDEWIHDGYKTAAHWIADNLDVGVATAREWIRVGRKLIEFPELEHAFATRTLSYSKVRTVSRMATPDSVRELIDIAQMTPVDYLGLALAEWSKKNETDDTRTTRHHMQRRLSYRVEPDGMISGSFRLPPAEAGVVMTAIDAQMMRRRALAVAGTDGDAHASADAHPSLAQRRADALVELAKGTDDSMITEMVVHVRADGCTLDDGTPLNDSVVAAMIHGAHLRALIHDADGRPINASSRQRHPTTRQKRVVKERDRRCVDCGSHDNLQYDHSPDFTQTRHTVVDELQLRCAPCHDRRHKGEAA
jgi:hypothetical protein